MTDNTQPKALRLADWLQSHVATYPQLSTDLPGGYCDEVDQAMDEAAAELRRQHARIAELEAELEAVGAGGVQALSAAPADIAKLRHLYANLKNGGVRDTAQAKRIADGLLAPIIERLEQAAPKAAPVVWLSSKQLRGVTALHGQYLPFRCQPEGRFDTPVYLVEAAPKAAPAPLSEDAFLQIRGALEAARNGLTWFMEMHPEDCNSLDDEMLAQIDAAIAAQGDTP